MKFWVKFANAKSMISDMAQNNPAALQSLQKEFGAGMTTQGQIGGTRAEGYGFKSMRYDDAATNYDNSKNIDAVNRQGTNALTTSNFKGQQDLQVQQAKVAHKASLNYKSSSIQGGVYEGIHGQRNRIPHKRIVRNTISIPAKFGYIRL